MTNHQKSTSWTALYEQLSELRASMCAAEQRALPSLDSVHRTQRESARNLLHYLELRRSDRSQLQRQLEGRGLSSLGRSESHVLATLEAVLGLVESIVREAPSYESPPADALTPERGRALLHEHAERLLGTPAGRGTRIMVTLPSEAAHDPSLVERLLSSGMDCARINAAHDDPEAWQAMARHVREASRKLGKNCMVTVDLPGPKFRTGALAPGPEVLKLRPRRGPSGEVREPARAWLTTTASGPSPSLPVSPTFLRGLSPGETITLRDARGRLRRWAVVSVRDDAAEIVCDRTSYVRPGTVLRAHSAEAIVGALAPLELPLVLRVGDTLRLTREPAPGRPVHKAHDGSVLASAHVPCVPPALLDMVRVGESVWLDDGKIGGLIEGVTHDELHVRITAARPQGEKLRAGKGINLPDSQISLSALTDRDERALTFALEAADMVAMSFVRTSADVHALQARVPVERREKLGVVLKIETREGFDHLPELLLTAMQSPQVGVMIARGDLAVECGFERLSEVQEEILWLCEAAHVPVIWATQVLETVAKTGRPTRAEVTDAAMAQRAECVMLNKGPYITQAVTLLDGILRRMASHQDKKSPMFRQLGVAARFEPPPP